MPSRVKRASIHRLAAAAVLALFLIGTATSCTNSDPRGAQRPPAAPEPVSPRGAVTVPFSFSWKAVPDVTSPVYRLRVTDAAERLLYERDLRGTECPPSNELTGMMGDRGRFFWTVGVVSDDGATVEVQSKPVEFSLR